jgi:hypothetical protein
MIPQIVDETGADPTFVDLFGSGRGDAQGIVELYGPGEVLITAILVVATWLVGKALTWSISVAWRLGFDPRHRLARTEGIFRVAIVGLCLYLVLLRFLHRAPGITSLALVIFLSAGAIALAPQVQNLVAGAQLLFRHKIRPGDRVQVQDCAGVVDRVGLTRMVLRATGGSRTHIPNRIFDQEVLTVVRAKDSVPAVLTLQMAQVVDAATIEAATALGMLSPYRVAGSRVHASRGEDAATTLQLEIHVWVESAREPAIEHLEAALRASGMRITARGLAAAEERK